ncbi:WD40-repeat-containing domain protein [Amylocarpus encephaloides]|uniref:WD40-repeat-containing domain protein n=1 Tax=Amylocarpus encephaloides TaxID=45428 RepID=A0A9P7YAB6_9HELO|nr:WD40-repeat-containing domain protein [Amylocarpus encephaloides]
MAKRKRNSVVKTPNGSASVASQKTKTCTPSTLNSPTIIQIVAGSYDRVLHGLTATISSNDEVEFADTFLFNAHTTAIRCLALSPPSAPVPKQQQKVILASGSTDERINLYHISAHAPSYVTVPAIAGLSAKAVVENPQNKELGSLLHHSSSVTALHFPNRSKLLSSAEDNTIAVTRTRDWSLLSAIKVPVPKSMGRPSGDTAPLGGAPSGVNDFAVHPSMKLMISVGKGEKSMRLWNLVTGKKAGVLNFERDILNDVGEGKFTSGEGRKVAWGTINTGEEEFCVAFDKGAVVYGMDSMPKCKVVPQPRTTSQKWTKVHQLCYLTVGEKENQLLAMSTEDGRILFYSTVPSDLADTPTEKGKEGGLASAKLVAIVDGKISKDTEKSIRIKDFTILRTGTGTLLIIAGRSDGILELYKLSITELGFKEIGDDSLNVGKLLGSVKTGNRITCLQAFIMLPKFEGEDIEEDFEGFDEDDKEDEEATSSSDDE